MLSLPANQDQSDNQAVITWDPTETSWAARRVAQLVGTTAAAPLRRLPARLSLRSRDAESLIEGVFRAPDSRSFNSHVVMVRHLYKVLGFDENYSITLHLEHKLLQAHILQAFVPDVAPVTRGLARLLHEFSATDYTRQTGSYISKFHVKRARGYGSLPDNANESMAARDLFLEAKPLLPTEPLDEEWVIQEKLSIEEEFRVHTFEGAVVEDLTFSRHSERPLGNKRDAPNRFVMSVIDRLPPAFLRNSLCGWDVVLTTDGRFRLIEINFAGYHTACDVGFQCSGFFQRSAGGVVLIGRLMRAIESHYGTLFDVEATPDCANNMTRLYSQLRQWLSFFRISRDLICLFETQQSIIAQERDAPSVAALFEVLKKMHATAQLVDRWRPQSGIGRTL